MSKLRIASWLILIIGIIFDLLHVTGFSNLLVLGTLLSFVYSVVYLINNFKSNFQESILNLTFSFWTLYLLVRFLYLPGGIYIAGFPICFIIPVIFSIAYLYLYVINKVKFKVSQLILTLVISFSVIISNVHSDRIYYFFNLNSTLNCKSRTLDYKSWDKYSWFLFIAKKQDEAIQANSIAQTANSKCLKVPHYFNVNRDSVLIKIHAKNILNKNWLDYP